MRHASLIGAVAVCIVCGCYGSPPAPAHHEPRGGTVAEPLYDDRTATLPPASARRSMEARAADFDGDGDLDLLVAREEAPNALLLNDGRGVFVDASDRVPREAEPHDHEDIAVADFDGDGDLDAVVSSEDDESKDFYLNDGRAHFSSAADRLPQRCASNAVLAADLDADGDVDLVFGCAGRDLLLLNDGRGHFTDRSASLPRGPNRRDVTQDVVAGDVDGDGDLDLVLANEDDNRLLLNDGRASFVDAAAGAVPLRPRSWLDRLRGRFDEESRNVDLADVDGDGDLDVLFSNVGWNAGNDAQDRLLINDGRGRFADETARRLPAEKLTTIASTLVDVDADGDVDIFTVQSMPGEHHRLLLNDGRGTFADATDRHLPPTLVGDGIEAEAADLDGDGRLDLYVSGYATVDQLLIRRR